MSHEKHPSDSAETHDEGRARGRFEGLIPDIVRKVINQSAEALGEEKVRETVVAELVRKALSKGGEVVDSTEDSLRRFISDLPLPNDVAERLGARLDDYKSDVLRVLRDEVHDFFDRIDLGHELQKMLTSLSFEITTEVRFIPNEKGVGSKVKKGVRPDVKSSARVRRRRRDEEEPGEPEG